MNKVMLAIEQLEMQIKSTVNTTSINTCRLAIEALEKQIKLQELGFTDDVLENYKKFEDECVSKGFNFKSLIEAREKQIPKKIEDWNGQASCPNCKKIYGNIVDIKRLISWEFPHCKWCGQKLDWGNEDE